jgi:aryl-alcohol dehydrogenase-like predicted oxidoreductase
VITGASSVEQVQENLGALEVASVLTDDVMKELEAAVS